MLTNPRGRVLFAEDWSREARRMVALFHATYDLWPGDPAFGALVDALRAGCPEFEGWWTAHDVGTLVSGRKVLHDPRLGQLTFEYANFQAHDNTDLKLTMYIPFCAAMPEDFNR